MKTESGKHKNPYIPSLGSEIVKYCSPIYLSLTNASVYLDLFLHETWHNTASAAFSKNFEPFTYVRGLSEFLKNPSLEGFVKFFLPQLDLSNSYSAAGLSASINYQGGLTDLAKMIGEDNAEVIDRAAGYFGNALLYYIPAFGLAYAIRKKHPFLAYSLGVMSTICNAADSLTLLSTASVLQTLPQNLATITADELKAFLTSHSMTQKQFDYLMTTDLYQMSYYTHMDPMLIAGLYTAIFPTFLAGLYLYHRHKKNKAENEDAISRLLSPKSEYRIPEELIEQAFSNYKRKDKLSDVCRDAFCHGIFSSYKSSIEEMLAIPFENDKEREETEKVVKSLHKEKKKFFNYLQKKFKNEVKTERKEWNNEEKVYKNIYFTGEDVIILDYDGTEMFSLDDLMDKKLGYNSVIEVHAENIDYYGEDEKSKKLRKEIKYGKVFLKNKIRVCASDGMVMEV